MATNTYVALATQTLGSAVSSVTFSSIPQGYTDLVLVAAPIVSSDTYNFLSVNGAPSGTAYSLTRLQGNGTSATSSRESNVARINIYWSNASTPSTYIVNFQNYANTTTNKTILAKCSNTADSVVETVGMWSSTAAISSVVLTAQVGNYNAGSTFTIYGIAAASVGAKATGGTIYQDASYFYHVFTGNGTFTPSQSLSCDVAVLSGGGGGGRYGGGGGGGGYRSLTAQSFSATGYSVTVGAGGAGGTGNDGAIGTASSINSISANPGGGGGGYDAAAPSGTYGSGGGGGYSDDGLTKAGAAGTAGQGYAGGTTGANYYAGSGGGGAGSVGAPSTSGRIGGNGGSGIALDYASVTGFGVSGYVAGGGGGCGQNGVGTGTAGGGTGATNNNGTAGTANTGGGGGGGYSASGGSAANGFAGGSGLVIVRYAK